MEKQRDIEIYSPRSMAPKVTASLNLTCKKNIQFKTKKSNTFSYYRKTQIFPPSDHKLYYNK